MLSYVAGLIVAAHVMYNLTQVRDIMHKNDMHVYRYTYTPNTPSLDRSAEHDFTCTNCIHLLGIISTCTYNNNNIIDIVQQQYQFTFDKSRIFAYQYIYAGEVGYLVMYILFQLERRYHTCFVVCSDHFFNTDTHYTCTCVYSSSIFFEVDRCFYFLWGNNGRMHA